MIEGTAKHDTRRRLAIAVVVTVLCVAALGTIHRQENTVHVDEKLQFVTETSKDVVGAKPDWDTAYRVRLRASWAEAASACMEYGLTLCTLKEYCPSGAGSNPALGRLSGDVWAPVRDKFNEWVQLADARVCKSHSQAAGYLPKWDYYGTINTVFRCCVGPVLPELYYSDASYRFILNGGWDAAKAQCASEGRKLCTLKQYCPNGPGSKPLLGRLAGDVWAPISDPKHPRNNWVQLADSRVCKDHFSVARVLPTWTSCCTPGRKTVFRCCS